MKAIWYLLKCPIGAETDYAKECQRLAKLDGEVLQEVICFQYQRMLRYGGEWHLERRMLLPGCIFLSGAETVMQRYGVGNWLKKNAYTETKGEKNASLIPCRRPYIKEICPKGELIPLSKGIIRNGKVIVTSGPLKGREHLIRKLDRHKRTAEIEFPFDVQKMRAIVGLEIYEKQI